LWLIDFDPESCDHLVFTPSAIVQIIKEKRSTRRLTEEEDQDLKRQRRLVKNRVSALASRNRKKEETELMEDQVARLRKENMIQREQIARLESENESLKKEMNSFREFTILTKIR
jgi:predicted RNase H-like nuclease (RuvC/YqgF family)